MGVGVGGTEVCTAGTEGAGLGFAHDTIAATSIRTAPAISTRLLRGEDIGTIRPSVAKHPNHPINRPAIWPPGFGTGIMPAKTNRGGSAIETVDEIVTARLKLTVPPGGIAIGGLKL